jgi:hypothetical protein
VYQNPDIRQATPVLINDPQEYWPEIKNNNSAFLLEAFH